MFNVVVDIVLCLVIPLVSIPLRTYYWERPALLSPNHHVSQSMLFNNIGSTFSRTLDACLV